MEQIESLLMMMSTRSFCLFCISVTVVGLGRTYYNKDTSMVMLYAYIGFVQGPVKAMANDIAFCRSL